MSWDHVSFMLGDLIWSLYFIGFTVYRRKTAFIRFVVVLCCSDLDRKYTVSGGMRRGERI